MTHARGEAAKALSDKTHRPDAHPAPGARERQGGVVAKLDVADLPSREQRIVAPHGPMARGLARDLVGAHGQPLPRVQVLAHVDAGHVADPGARLDAAQH